VPVSCSTPASEGLKRSVASMVIVNIEWERELSWFIMVAPTTRFFLPTCSMQPSPSSAAENRALMYLHWFKCMQYVSCACLPWLVRTAWPLS
jgi:hypothetical protein